MVKIFFIVIFLISSSTSSNIECDYHYNYYPAMGSIYECFVKKNPIIITEESAEINGVSGMHEGSKSNDDVTAFYPFQKTIQFFPKGLEKIFKNLKAIYFYDCQLKEIHQSDLKAFPNLVYFNLAYNEIEVIEEGLFDFNPNLEVVKFYESEIIHIDSNVFNHLTKLSHLWFSVFPCSSQDIQIVNSTEKVQEAIKIVKSSCSNSEFLSLKNQIKNLEIESKTLSSETLKMKLETFGKSFKNSKLSKTRILNYKFQNLKLIASCPHCIILKEISSLTANDVSLGGGLKTITDKFEDLKLSQCGLKSHFIDLKSSQNALQTTLNAIKTSADGQESKLDQIQDFQKQFKDSMSSSINNVFSKVNEVSSTQETMKTSLNQIEIKVNDLKSSQSSSLTSLDSKFNELKVTQNDLRLTQENIGTSIDSVKASQNNLNTRIDDIEETLGDLKKSQQNFENSLETFTNFQNEIQESLQNIMKMLRKEFKKTY